MPITLVKRVLRFVIIHTANLNRIEDDENAE